MNLEKVWNGPRDRFSHLQNFANVCVAAAVSQTLSFPFDTVKRKMQVRSIGEGWGKGAVGGRLP
jgi:solute carrier family 25 protein 43